MQKVKTILVVEDEIPLLQAAKLMLERNGLKVVTARTVGQAKDYLKELVIVDAIWLDHYLLGKENGLDFLAWCKNEAEPKYRDLPVYVVTNTASSDQVTAYMKLGVKEYFVKSNHRLDEIIRNITTELNPAPQS